MSLVYTRTRDAWGFGGRLGDWLPDELAGLDAINEKRIILLISGAIGYPIRKLPEAHLEYLLVSVPASDDANCNVVFHESNIHEMGWF